MRSGRAGPSFSVRPEKEAKGAEATVATVACARHFSSDKIEPRTNPFGEAPQTQRLTAFQTHGKVRFCPPGKNPLTSHAVRCYKCCLGLPLAFCAAFRCSLRWRFTTRLFVHVFLPFGFFDKLQKHRPVHSHWAVFFLL